MAKEPKGELVVIEAGFDYAPLQPKTAEKVREAAQRIRETVKRTIEDIIAVGNDLLSVKESLDHGQFLPWLRAEFGWTERTARNFMAVAEQFGPKSEMISDLKIAPTAAYLLAAPSAPDEARQKAVERAEAGEHITPKLAKEILAKERKKTPRKKRGGQQLDDHLAKVLNRLREGWSQKDLGGLAEKLREFADSLEEEKGSTRKKGG
jgi:hypothetical protein